MSLLHTHSLPAWALFCQRVQRDFFLKHCCEPEFAVMAITRSAEQAPEAPVVQKKTKRKTPSRPDVAKKQKRVQKIVEDPDVQVKLEKKVANKRSRSDLDKVAKNGGDDSRKTKQKKAQPEQLQDTSAESKSVRSRNPRRSNKNAPVVASSS
jgi:hypothetical protein